MAGEPGPGDVGTGRKEGGVCPNDSFSSHDKGKRGIFKIGEVGTQLTRERPKGR